MASCDTGSFSVKKKKDGKCKEKKHAMIFAVAIRNFMLGSL